MTRLRIGHTRLTHGYYMTRGRPPECCNTSLTIEHLLLRCTKHTNLRRKHNLPKDLKDLLGPDSPKDKIMLFLKKAGVYEEFDGDGDDDYDNEGLSPKFVNSRTKGKK